MVVLFTAFVIEIIIIHKLSIYIIYYINLDLTKYILPVAKITIINFLDIHIAKRFGN